MPKRKRTNNGNSNGTSRSSNGGSGNALPLQAQMAVDAGSGTGAAVPHTASIDLLNYNQRVPMQTAIDSYGWHESLPLTHLPDYNHNTPLVFRFEKIEKSYSHLFGGFLDFDISIYGIDANTGRPIDLQPNELVCPINLCGLTYWSRVELWSGDLQVLGYYNDYANIAYNYVLLYGNEYAKRYGMQTWGWFPDTPGAMDTVSITGTDQNAGATTRLGMFADSTSVNFVVPVMFDMNGVINLIPDRADLQLRYYRHTPEFFLMTGGGNVNSYVVQLDRAVFRMIRYTLSASELVHQNRLLSSNGILLAAQQQQIKHKTFGVGEQNLHFTSFREVLPTMILIYFTTLQASNGDYKYNPFNYILPPIRRVVVYKNDIPYGIPNGISLNNTQRQTMVTPYFYLWQMLHGGSPTIFPTDMANGYCVFCFDMTAGNTSNTSISSKPESGTIRVEVDLETPVANDSIVMHIQGLFQKAVKISGQREITVIDLK